MPFLRFRPLVAGLRVRPNFYNFHILVMTDFGYRSHAVRMTSAGLPDPALFHPSPNSFVVEMFRPAKGDIRHVRRRPLPRGTHLESSHGRGPGRKGHHRRPQQGPPGRRPHLYPGADQGSRGHHRCDRQAPRTRHRIPRRITPAVTLQPHRGCPLFYANPRRPRWTRRRDANPLDRQKPRPAQQPSGPGRTPTPTSPGERTPGSPPPQEDSRATPPARPNRQPAATRPPCAFTPAVRDAKYRSVFPSSARPAARG
ncbi:hypothetical protein GDI3809 [Gluconacetobacter diazotrophicus PA1 5]|uniref:Uncharacterized protein n=1 Tax=Gluconacetobacter diazotrophicus (strain ATCC 49037 / DSM 5601 / CCUG 37298 / CIP 103539 / LMG 7603 / PAl5) TaxID=272568 RepID=A9H9U5_GLUDA|nr:hypothetical protein GDI3809 [Gluconacetobacter diazotrophicus PA1 5]